MINLAETMYHRQRYQQNEIKIKQRYCKSLWLWYTVFKSDAERLVLRSSRLNAKRLMRSEKCVKTVIEWDILLYWMSWLEWALLVVRILTWAVKRLTVMEDEMVRSKWEISSSQCGENVSLLLLLLCGWYNISIILRIFLGAWQAICITTITYTTMFEYTL